MTDCARTESLLALEVGGDLELAEREILERHLAGCPSCRRARRELSATRDWLQRAASGAASEVDVSDLRRSVLQQIDLTEAVSRRRLSGRRLAAAALLLAFVGLAVWRPEAPPSDRLTPPADVAASASEPVAEASPPPRIAVAPPTAPPESADRGGPIRSAAAVPSDLPPDSVPAAGPSDDRPPTSSLVFKLIDEENDLVFYWLGD